MTRELFAILCDTGLLAVNVERAKALSDAERLSAQLGRPCDVVVYVETQERVRVSK